MTVECESLDRFLDGELGVAQADAFRRHLGTCRTCPDRLEQAVVIDSLAEEALLGEVAARPLAGPRPQGAGDGDGRHRHPGDELALRRTRRWVTAAAGLAAAAAALLVLGIPERGPPELASLLAQTGYRTTEGRLSYPGLERHRPLARERSGTLLDAFLSGREQVLAQLEDRRDHHGLAMVFLLEGKYDQAARHLARAAPSAAVLADGAALAIERGDARGALAMADEALAAPPDGGGSRAQAMWNRAVALALLGSRDEAAAAYRAVAALGEPGWSDEARQRAAELQDSAGATPR